MTFMSKNISVCMLCSLKKRSSILEKILAGSLKKNWVIISAFCVLFLFFTKAASRGIKNLASVEQKKKKQEEMEKRLETSGSGIEGGGLRVIIYMYHKFTCSSSLVALWLKAVHVNLKISGSRPEYRKKE